MSWQFDVPRGNSEADFSFCAEWLGKGLQTRWKEVIHWRGGTSGPLWPPSLSGLFHLSSFINKGRGREDHLCFWHFSCIGAFTHNPYVGWWVLCHSIHGSSLRERRVQDEKEFFFWSTEGYYRNGLLNLDTFAQSFSTILTQVKF